MGLICANVNEKNGGKERKNTRPGGWHDTHSAPATADPATTAEQARKMRKKAFPFSQNLNMKPSITIALFSLLPSCLAFAPAQRPSVKSSSTSLEMGLTLYGSQGSRYVLLI